MKNENNEIEMKENKMNNLLEKLNAAKAESARLDAVRQALPDTAPDADVAAANKAYFGSLAAQGLAQRAYNRSIATPAQLAAQAEQAEAQQQQLAAHQRLLAKDARTTGIPKTQAELDAEYDAELERNQD